ncbi:hypothetical protein VARIO8X_120039 [Burkholderiales bacterium 8X]|nr:hypothetical protein VARIO8X_120039 [Burkholderiales bacterium 8X]
MALLKVNVVYFIREQPLDLLKDFLSHFIEFWPHILVVELKEPLHQRKCIFGHFKKSDEDHLISQR